jgi:hypothetical protein
VGADPLPSCGSIELGIDKRANPRLACRSRLPFVDAYDASMGG